MSWQRLARFAVVIVPMVVAARLAYHHDSGISLIIMRTIEEVVMHIDQIVTPVFRFLLCIKDDAHHSPHIHRASVDPPLDLPHADAIVLLVLSLPAAAFVDEIWTWWRSRRWGGDDGASVRSVSQFSTIIEGIRHAVAMPALLQRCGPSFCRALKGVVTWERTARFVAVIVAMLIAARLVYRNDTGIGIFLFETLLQFMFRLFWFVVAVLRFLIGIDFDFRPLPPPGEFAYHTRIREYMESVVLVEMALPVAFVINVAWERWGARWWAHRRWARRLSSRT